MNQKDETSTPAVSDAHLQEITQEVYKRNIELAVVNKTLSLLRKLYQISLLALDPAMLSEKISETVRVDLNLEAVAIFLYDETNDSLKSFKFSKSDRLATVTNTLGIVLNNIEIGNAFKRSVLKQVVHDQKPVFTNDMAVWEGIIDPSKLKTVIEQSNIKTDLLFPLMAQGKIIGVLMLGLNRDYESLSHFEKDSVASFTDVIAVALDKALVYQQLQVVNEQLKALDQARAEFISIASHQLRTPPATIKWYLAAILGGDFGPVTDQLKKAIGSAEMTNNGLISLIDDLLNASRIERGKMEFIFEPVDLVKLTKLTVDQLRPLAQQKKQTLAFELPDEIAPVVADKEKIRQVTNNFIDNAIKYTPAGGRINVEMSKTETDVILKVSDNGRGIAKEDLAGVFEKYNRGMNKTDSQGLGLGLFVAKVVVEQHNGKIWAESKGVGKGSSFCFSLPTKSDLKMSTYDLVKK